MSDEPLALVIRPFADADLPAVRALFVQVNRDLAPPAMHAAFEAYIVRALREEIDRIPAYYAERQGGFWVCRNQDGALLGTFGFERAAEDGAAELRRMYVQPSARRRGVARAMLAHAERKRDAPVIGASCSAPRSFSKRRSPSIAAPATRRSAKSSRPPPRTRRSAAASGASISRSGCRPERPRTVYAR